MNEAAILKNNLLHVKQRGMREWGDHGIAHWWRVRHNGLMIAESNGVDTSVIKLFALCHDAFRINEYTDPPHGPRAANWLRLIRSGSNRIQDPVQDEIRAAVMALDEESFESLAIACEIHTSDDVPSNETIATCLAADRLDLWRVGIQPDPDLILIRSFEITTAIVSEAMQRSDAGLRLVDPDQFEATWRLKIPGQIA